MTRKAARDRTFLVGAGASRGSGLPDGAMLATRIFNLLTEGRPVLVETSAVAKVRAALEHELRLETFLEILAGEVSAEIAFKPFTSLEKAEPCFAHFAILALSRGTLITTNQDILFERAAQLLRSPRRIIHVHGRCDQIASIVTIISQYLGGLDRSIRASFQNVIRGRPVVVFGYSGRDRDVMPALIAARPKRVEWLLHAGSPISPELERARVILGDRLVIESVDSNQWLESQLTSSERTRIRALATALPDKPPPLRYDWFRPITFVQRNRAVARILEHLGAYREALDVYRQLCKATKKDARLILDLGRVTARVEGHAAAREIYRSIARRKDLPIQVRAQLQLDDADALRNSSRATEAKLVLEKLERLLHDNRRAFSKKALEQFQGWLQSALAGIDRLEGQVASARQLYARAQRAFSRARDIDGRIDTLTWQSETALISGDVRHALELSDAAICDSIAYAKSLVKAWPWYVKAEALVLSGRCDEAARMVGQMHDVFEANGNVQGIFWTLILEIDCLKNGSWRRAQKLLDEVRVRLGRKSLAHVRARLLLEQADLARAARDWLRVERALSKLQLHLQNRSHFSRRPRLIEAHASLVEAECARDRASAEAPDLLGGAYKKYERLGAKAMAARAAVALALAQDGKAPIKKLRDYCASRGYNREVRALDTNARSYYPIQFI